MSAGALSLTNLQTAWPVAGVEVWGARHGGRVVGPNGGRSARISRTRRSSIRNITMRRTVTEALFREWLNSRVEWRFLGVEWDKREVKTPRCKTGTWGTQFILGPCVWATRPC